MQYKTLFLSSLFFVTLVLPAQAHQSGKAHSHQYSYFWLGHPPKSEKEVKEKLGNPSLGQTVFVSKIRIPNFHTLTNN